MRRTLVPLAVSFVLACASDDAATTGAGGASGAGSVVATSGPGGSAGTSAASGGSGGATSATGGGGGSGGSAGDAGSSGSEDASLGDSSDAPAADASDVSIASDANIRDASAEGDGNPGGDTLPGKPWIHLCPKTDTHEECCAFLCNCLSTVCADSPLDKMGIANCMANCPKLTDMTLRCHVYHCYESLNPSVPQDHASHCGHASGRVAGGGCPPAVYGP
jgi:hypothetical protein